MGVVEASILIRCTPEIAFDLSQDYDQRLKWDPFLADLRFLDGATVGAVGVRTWVRSKRGMEMVSEYVAWDRPSVVAIKMVQADAANTKSTRMFEQFGGSWRFRLSRNDPAMTEVAMRYTFRMRPRWLAWAMEPVAQWMFGRDVRGRLRGLKHGVETLRLHERVSAPA